MSRPHGLRVQAELRPGHDLANSSSVPNPPGRAMKPSERLGHHRLALVHRMDDVQGGDAVVRELARDERVRDDAGDLPARVEDGVGDDAHQSDVAAAVDEMNPARGERVAQRAGRDCKRRDRGQDWSRRTRTDSRSRGRDGDRRRADSGIEVWLRASGGMIGTHGCRFGEHRCRVAAMRS